MAAFYWHKACRGLYYLYDKPKPRAGAEFVAKAISRAGQSYLNTVKLEGATHPTGWGRTPKTALAWVEEEIRRLVPSATFTRENF